MTNTFNSWDFRLFRRSQGHFLFRNNLFGSLWYLKDISEITFRGYVDHWNKMSSTAKELDHLKPKVSDKYL